MVCRDSSHRCRWAAWTDPIVSLFVIRTTPRLGRVVDGSIKFPATLSHIVLAVGFVLALGGEPFNLAGTILILMLAYLALYFPQTAVAADGAVGQVGRELPEASRVAGAGEGGEVGGHRASHGGTALIQRASRPGIQSVPASGTPAMAAASTVRATRSSGSRL